jgi:hypothetical protein
VSEQDPTEPIAFDLKRAAAAVSLSIRELQTAIGDNELVAYYRGRKPLIEPAELRPWFDSLPTEPHRRS